MELTTSKIVFLPCWRRDQAFTFPKAALGICQKFKACI